VAEAMIMMSTSEKASKEAELAIERDKLEIERDKIQLERDTMKERTRQLELQVQLATMQAGAPTTRNI
jgi:cell division protein FtsL